MVAKEPKHKESGEESEEDVTDEDMEEEESTAEESKEGEASAEDDYLNKQMDLPTKSVPFVAQEKYDCSLRFSFRIVSFMPKVLYTVQYRSRKRLLHIFD